MGHVTLTDIVPGPEGWDWVLADPVPLLVPVRAGGLPSLWHPPEGLMPS